MRTRPGLIAAVLLGVVVLLAAGVVLDPTRGLVLPGPQTQSTFLRQYSPQPVVEQYRSQAASQEWLNGTSNGAGKQFATASASFDGRFALAPERKPMLMAALDQDLAAQLTGAGAKILTQSGDTLVGYRYAYRLGKSLGTVTIAPMQAGEQNAMLTAAGTAPVRVKVDVEEKWFPKGAP